MRVNNKGHQEIQSEKYPVLSCDSESLEKLAFEI